MDKLIEVLFQYGPLAGLVVVLLYALGKVVTWFVDREMTAYENRMKAMGERITTCENRLQNAAENFIAHVKASCGDVSSEVSLAKTAVGQLQTQITKEMMNLKALSVDVQKRNIKDEKETKELLGEVKLIRTKQEQYDQIFKKLIDKTKGSA